MYTRRRFLIGGLTTLALGLTACTTAGASTSQPTAPSGGGGVVDQSKPTGAPTSAPSSTSGATGAVVGTAMAPGTASTASGELLVGVDLELSGPASVWAQTQLEALNDSGSPAGPA